MKMGVSTMKTRPLELIAKIRKYNLLKDFRGLTVKQAYIRAIKIGLI